MKSLESSRLIFRSFKPEDAPIVYNYLQEREIIDNTISIPYPYLPGMAEEWISTHSKALEEGVHTFAIVLKDERKLIGAIDIIVDDNHKRGLLGYWLGKPFWNMGYGTEAIARIIQYGFEDLRLNKISAEHFDFNHASARVMEKNKMQLEGILRSHIFKNDKFVNIHVRAILRSEWTTNLDK